MITRERFFAALREEGIEANKDKEFYDDQLKRWANGEKGVDMDIESMDILARLEDDCLVDED